MSASNKSRLPLLITTGEPAGIGMDVVLTYVCQHYSSSNRPIVVLADHAELQRRLVQLRQNNISMREKLDKVVLVRWSLPQWQTQYADYIQSQSDQDVESEDGDKVFLPVIDIACAATVESGVLDVANAVMVITQLQVAHRLAISGQVAAIVTAPLQKSVINQAQVRLADGSQFTGHTEFFMNESGLDKVVMMLANQTMKVALVTTHLPLRLVADAITSDNVRQTVDIVLADMRQKFGIENPRLLICGLNPHAGEGGYLGREEIEVINPVIELLRQQGHDLSFAMPADTVFTRSHLQQADAVIAMYHDQGLAPLKSHGFGETVNLTLGLPYIRTSVDHGTALDIAGTGRASCDSLAHAILMADKMATASA